MDLYKAARAADADQIRKDFSRRLLAKLRDAGMNQTELAQATGLSKDAISTYARCRSIPGKANLKKLADALGIDQAELAPSVALETSSSKASPVTLTMIGSNRVRIRLEAEIPLNAATQILELINQTADAEGGG